MLGKYQLQTGERLSLRRLADVAGVPKDLVDRLDAGEARYIGLQDLARLCRVLDCQIEELLIWANSNHDDGAAS
jgi:DNA-binding Xre family transcriptional regulator